MPASPVPDFDLDGVDARWSPLTPELAVVANSVSLLMPAVEPWIAASVRRALTELGDEPAGDDLAARAAWFRSEELGHAAVHRRLNQVICGRYRFAAAVEDLARWGCRRLARAGRLERDLAVAAGFEAVAFATARWVAANGDSVLLGADPRVTDVFLWHLRQEVAHKNDAIDLYRRLAERRGIRRPRLQLAVGHAIGLGLVAITVLSSLGMLARDGRVLHPVAWWRLLRWSISYAFELLPTVAVSLSRNHHPSQLADPRLPPLRTVATPLGPRSLAEHLPR